MSDDVTVRADRPDFFAFRSDEGRLQIRLDADGTTITLVMTTLRDDAARVAEDLRELAGSVDALIENWEPSPDPYDAFVAPALNGYELRLNCELVGVYPTREIAEYELDRAMHRDGYIPDAWLLDERGGHTLLPAADTRPPDPLPGAEYAVGDLVRCADRPFVWRVLGDWGALGVEVQVVEDPETRRHVTDRSLLRPARE
ncbi:hypothetical protein AB0M43_35020 [Longispora sp. NPDC051575]|uniref:hypothetical protein n=1 Tax=Longispora sp. NPDC051575 TaxID=3154943 RepID=UPI0034244ABB